MIVKDSYAGSVRSDNKTLNLLTLLPNLQIM